jgi:hypothetical protein
MNVLKRMTSLLVVVALISFGAQLSTQRSAAALTFSVTNTSSSGAGSLAQAISDANASPGADIINFAIGGSGPHVISVTTPISITDTVTIDGTNGGGSTCATANDPASFNVVLDGGKWQMLDLI